MGATFVGVMGKDSSPCGGRDAPGVVRSKLRQQLGDLFPVGGDQHFAAEFQKLLDAIPRVSDQASAGASSFKDARRRRNSLARHTLAIENQRGYYRGDESVEVGTPDP